MSWDKTPALTSKHTESFDHYKSLSTLPQSNTASVTKMSKLLKLCDP